MEHKLTDASRMLDYKTVEIQQLITTKGWQQLSQYNAIGAVYDYVRNEIAFGYNRADNIPASMVLRDGYGQCNTKGTLFMALLRALGIPCRMHGFTIVKSLQRGVVPELAYRIAPDNIMHSWVEVYLDGKWVKLEGFILDDAFLAQIQSGFASQDPSLCSYGVGTDNLSAPGVQWKGKSTYIQKTGINQDLGVFDTPDAFNASHKQDLSWVKQVLYRYVIRHWMNARVSRIRMGKFDLKTLPNDDDMRRATILVEAKNG